MTCKALASDCSIVGSDAGVHRCCANPAPTLHQACTDRVPRSMRSVTNGKGTARRIELRFGMVACSASKRRS